MPRYPDRREANVGPKGNRVQALYEKDSEGDAAKRSLEVQDLIAQMILLSHKRGRVKKEKENHKYVA